MNYNGELSRIRTIAASSTLDRDTKLVVRQTRRGYEFYANGDSSPIKCDTWLQARSILLRLGVPHQKLDEINTRLVEGKGLVIRRTV